MDPIEDSLQVSGRGIHGQREVMISIDLSISFGSAGELFQISRAPIMDENKHSVQHYSTSRIKAADDDRRKVDGSLIPKKSMLR